MRKRIALVAHNAKKKDMVEWANFNRGTLEKCDLWGTKTTGSLVRDEVGLHVTLLLSGPEGGDSQLGAMISERKVDIVVFFWDPLSVQPHDVDVKALLRLAVLYDVPIACNRSSADYLISSPLFIRGSEVLETANCI
ncbi:MAG: methylglyoxal synthase [Spirochaetota bacterium]|nr:methylglyoxal synthase [Spirochaetota bacterium]